MNGSFHSCYMIINNAATNTIVHLFSSVCVSFFCRIDFYQCNCTIERYGSKNIMYIYVKLPSKLLYQPVLPIAVCKCIPFPYPERGSAFNGITDELIYFSHFMMHVQETLPI